MDPNELLRKIEMYLELARYHPNQGDKETISDFNVAADAFDDLCIWMARGGFLPDKWNNQMRKK